MSLLVLASAKASPGVTTAALALSAGWPPDRELRIFESDPDGGDLAARCGLATEPGLSTLAVSARRATAVNLADHLQLLPGGEVGVVVAPPTAEQVRRSLELLGPRVVALLAGAAGSDTIVDAGRLRPGTPVWPLIEAADALLLVTRPRVEELQHLPARLRSLRAIPSRVGVILVGDRPYPTAEVAAALEADVVGVLADDARGALVLNGERRVASSRSLLLRSARDLAEVLTGWATARGTPETDRMTAPPGVVPRDAEVAG